VNVPFLDLAAGHRELEGELGEAFRRTLASGVYIGGESLFEFEREFARFCGARHCVGVGNGLDALTLALRSLEIGAGDEVIVPAHTFLATWLAVSQVGARVVPVDVEPATLNIDPGKIPQALTARTRAIIVVHLYGMPANLDPVLELARARSIRVIEDAAQAHGAMYKGRRVGGLGDAACFSFYPVKNLGAMGDGGAVVTGSEALANRVRILGNYGSRQKYEHELQGVNSRLDPLQASFLRVKLARLEEWNLRRQRVAGAYLEGLAGIPGLRLPGLPSEVHSVWHQFVVRHPERDVLRERLAAAGIDTLIHYPVPPHLTKAYAAHGWKPGDFPVAEQAASTVLSLPMGPHMKPESIDWVVEATRMEAGRLSKGYSA
jgi:dTDP-3-amino-3,4,6-trideoxy-alpha-D-glucose transaminase